MAAAGASKSNFSGYQSASDAQKNLPAPAARTSMALDKPVASSM